MRPGRQPRLAPLAQIALTSLIVNSRHLFYALSFPLLHAFWVGGATTGALLGAALPLERLHGFDFALTKRLDDSSATTGDWL